MSQHENIVDTLTDELTFLRDQKEILEQREKDLRAAILDAVPDQTSDQPHNQPGATQHLGYQSRTRSESQNPAQFPDALKSGAPCQSFRYHRSVVSAYVRVMSYGPNGGSRPPR